MASNGHCNSLPRILVTGATGYVGGRLLRRLEDLGYPVRCLARRPESLAGDVAPATEVDGGDALVSGDGRAINGRAGA